MASSFAATCEGRIANRWASAPLSLFAIRIRAESRNADRARGREALPDGTADPKGSVGLIDEAET